MVNLMKNIMQLYSFCAHSFVFCNGALSLDQPRTINHWIGGLIESAVGQQSAHTRGEVTVLTIPAGNHILLAWFLDKAADLMTQLRNDPHPLTRPLPRPILHPAMAAATLLLAQADSQAAHMAFWLSLIYDLRSRTSPPAALPLYSTVSVAAPFRAVIAVSVVVMSRVLMAVTAKKITTVGSAVPPSRCHGLQSLSAVTTKGIAVEVGISIAVEVRVWLMKGGHKEEEEGMRLALQMEGLGVQAAKRLARVVAVKPGLLTRSEVNPASCVWENPQAHSVIITAGMRPLNNPRSTGKQGRGNKSMIESGAVALSRSISPAEVPLATAAAAIIIIILAAEAAIIVAIAIALTSATIIAMVMKRAAGGLLTPSEVNPASYVWESPQAHSATCMRIRNSPAAVHSSHRARIVTAARDRLSISSLKGASGQHSR